MNGLSLASSMVNKGFRVQNCVCWRTAELPGMFCKAGPWGLYWGTMGQFWDADSELLEANLEKEVPEDKPYGWLMEQKPRYPGWEEVGSARPNGLGTSSLSNLSPKSCWKCPVCPSPSCTLIKWWKSIKGSALGQQFLWGSRWNYHSQ